MVSERIQRRIDRLLEEADEAVAQRNWLAVLGCAQTVLSLDPENPDALIYLAAAQRGVIWSTNPSLVVRTSLLLRTLVIHGT